MSFFGRSFVYDGIPSETHNLFISSPDGGDVKTSGGSDTEVISEKIRRRSRLFTYGFDQSPTLKFEIMVNAPSKNGLTAVDIEVAKRWLLGRQGYKKLQIMQPDMQDVYFNCIFTNSQEHKVGNIIRGLTFDVICDAPWGFAFDKILTYDYIVAFIDTTIFINNLSDDNYYLYPQLDVTMNSTGGDITITNANDNGRIFEFTSMSPDEVISINNDLQIMESSTGLFRLSNFNKNWLRLVRGINELSVVGNVSQLLFTLQYARKIGG